MSDIGEGSMDVYDGEFVRETGGRTFGLWVSADQGWLELYIGGHEVMIALDTAEGTRALIADMESIKTMLGDAQIALVDRVSP